MNLFSFSGRRQQISPVAVGSVLLLAFTLTGCKRDESKVYTVPADAAAPASPALPPNHPPLGSGAMPPGAMTDAPALPQWTVPANWTEETPSQMLLAKFSVTDKDAGGARADITVSSFPGDVGGLLANVNRWRGQIGLPPVDATEMEKLVQKLDVQGDAASLVEMDGTDGRTGQPARMISVAVPHEGQTWFFKMLGNAAVVSHEKEAFVKFVQSVKLPHAP